MKLNRIRAWTREEIIALGGLTDLETAGQILNRGRTRAYLEARSGTFPVEVIDERTEGDSRKSGSVRASYKVRVYDLLRYLRMCPCDGSSAYHADHTYTPTSRSCPGATNEQTAEKR